MKSLLAFLLVFLHFHPSLADTTTNSAEEIIAPDSAPQKVVTRFQTDFDFFHDRGLYFNATLGPAWNHSIQKPEAKAVRFGGNLSLGWFIADGVALHASAWGNFLEQATLIAIGPGIAALFNGPNMGLDFSLGVGRVFNATKQESPVDFAETVLAAQLSLAKYWWLSPKTSLGVSLFSGLHGLTITTGSFGSFGWNIGLGLSFLLG